MKFILFAAFILFVITVGPLATIWALNTLFPVLAIPFTFETWCAAVIIGGLFKTSISAKNG